MPPLSKTEHEEAVMRIMSVSTQQQLAAKQALKTGNQCAQGIIREDKSTVYSRQTEPGFRLSKSQSLHSWHYPCVHCLDKPGGTAAQETLWQEGCAGCGKDNRAVCFSN
jgi:hypothetical protein